MPTDQERINYLEAQQQREGIETGTWTGDYLVLGHDWTPHWGKTYREALDKAIAAERACLDKN